MGVGLLLDVFEEIATKIPNIFLYLIGDFRESEASYFKSKINELKNAEKIKVTGYMDHSQVLNFVRHCDIMLYPSLSDGCPNKVLESMFMKKAIIGSNSGGISDILENDKDGILIHPYDKTTWVNKIFDLSNNPEMRTQLGLNAYKKVTTKFIKKNTLNDWINLYRSIGICI